MLELDSVRVPGYDLMISGNLQIASEDVSGETSGTDDVDKGFKAKRFSVSLSVRFEDAKQLKQIVQMAEKKNDKEERHIYTISNQTANIAGVRKVRFSENLNWSQKDGLQAWDVSFELKEVLSTSERKEQREKRPPVATQQSEGKSVGEETNLLKLVATTEQQDKEIPQTVSQEQLLEEISTSDAADAVTTNKNQLLSTVVDDIKKEANANNVEGLKDAIRKGHALIQNLGL